MYQRILWKARIMILSLNDVRDNIINFIYIAAFQKED